MKRRTSATPRRNRRLTLAAENIDMALRAVRSNRLRSSLTIAIIALGITSLVGILTAVDSMDATLKDAYSRMGAGIINIRSLYSMPADMRRIRNSREISRAQAERFTDYYRAPATVTIFTTVLSGTRAEAGQKRTNPTTDVIATDGNYMKYNMLELSSGRSLSAADVEGGRFYCVIGDNVARTLFEAQEDPVGQTVHISGRSYIIIGVAAPVGNNAGGSMDGSILVPYTNALANLATSTPDFTIGILPDPSVSSEAAATEAEMTFRAVRRLAPFDDADFRITRSEAVIEELNSTMRTLTIAAIVIGLVTLTGAAVGLMNIMLVSVRERTREIGTRKALGAASKRIKAQFLMESVIIGQTGGLIGIAAGILIGNIIAAVMQASFVIPWLWMLLAIALCMAVGILSGYLPAKRAAALDPIECLRYE
ncbi:MAG TPA: ABC transporter permease [Candidatus Coprenecus avistercoris]|uniref:ABC transporter permease n=1 Tax=Candidatus Coprenecus avistercoris TaxID=2840730 RepID=A0A9D1J7D2_9BACT|nr:ABC transporter permease [Candidatus Coprenecus avistercoris]